MVVMDKVVEIIEWVGYCFAVIGAVASIVKAVEVWINIQRLTWSKVDKYSKKIIAKISQSNYVPEIIVTIGRGGAIVGSILSGNLPVKGSISHNIPILGTDRLYTWDGGERYEFEDNLIDLNPLSGKRVLLVAGDVVTGETMKMYAHDLLSAGVNDLRTACLVKSVGSAYKPDYYGKEITAKFKMPWMYKGYNYIRDSREPY